MAAKEVMGKILLCAELALPCRMLYLWKIARLGIVLPAETNLSYLQCERQTSNPGAPHYIYSIPARNYMDLDLPT
jgi:hypothetical protein